MKLVPIEARVGRRVVFVERAVAAEEEVGEREPSVETRVVVVLRG